MPCWRCGAREVDPPRGPSPWKRGVRGGAHVLVCPACQWQQDWSAELDHCPSCGSWRLARALGQVSCRECGATTDTVAGEVVDPVPATRTQGFSASALATEVTEALERLWGKAPGR